MKSIIIYFYAFFYTKIVTNYGQHASFQGPLLSGINACIDYLEEFNKSRIEKKMAKEIRQLEGCLPASP